MINRVFGFPLDQGERDRARFLEMPGAPLGDHEHRSGNDLAGPTGEYIFEVFQTLLSAACSEFSNRDTSF